MGQHPKKLELSWHKPSRQWRKRYKGKEYYLGPGRGRSDLEGYERALAKWRSISATVQQAAKTQTQSALQRAYRAWGEQLASRPGIDINQYVSQTAVSPNGQRFIMSEEMSSQAHQPQDAAANYVANAKRYGDVRPNHWRSSASCGNRRIGALRLMTKCFPWHADSAVSPEIAILGR